MKPCTLAETARWSGGEIVQGDPNLPIRRFHTDTRTLRAGDCFVALPGDRFDGHNFLELIEKQGAIAVLVSRQLLPPFGPTFGVVQVPDTLRALQQVAGAYRASLPVRTIGVTGSSGKTSTKELIAAVLRTRFKTKATEGNLNNHLGVPLTLLELETSDIFAVIEMGMNHPGEIAPLVRLAQPEIGVISSIGPVHLEFFSDQAAIAEEKAELLKGLPATGRAVLNGDDEWSRRVAAARSTAPIIWTGDHPGSRWRAEKVQVTREIISFELCDGELRQAVRLPVPNRVMVSNALVAAAVGAHLGLSLEEIAAGLSAVKLPGSRMQIVEWRGATLIDDSYNANPSSMVAALRALRDFPASGRRLAVLGSMGELGADATHWHIETGRAAAESAIDHMIAVGPNAESYRRGGLSGGLQPQQIEIVFDANEATETLRGKLQPGDVVLVKGSRFMHLDQLVQTLRAENS